MLEVEQGGRSKQARKRWATGAPPPSPFIAEEGQPAPPTITCNDGFPCMSQGLVKSCSCRGSMGQRRRPRPINRHASTEAVGFWGPRCSVLDPWLRLEAKPESALGPGATFGVLGSGIPRPACMRPVTWLKGWPSMSHLHQLKLKTLSRGQASRGGRPEASSGRLARRRRDQGRGTSRGACDASHDDQGAGRRQPALACAESLFPLWCKGGKRR